MKIRIVEDMEKWIILKAAIIEKGYKLHQFQYSYYQNEGFNAYFFKTGKLDLKLITHLHEIENDIVSSKMT